MKGKPNTRPPKSEIEIATKKPSCSLIRISPQSSWPRSAMAEHSGSVRKLKIGFQTVKQITMPMMKAMTEWMSRVRSSARCSINGAELSSIS